MAQSPQKLAEPDRLAPVSGFRLGLISGLAAIVGCLAGFVAFILYDLIALFTNLAFYHHISVHFQSPLNNKIGWSVILVALAGGLIVGVMAKYGSEKIKGHGIPEAMEAVLVSGSRILPKVAILKPLSAAIAIGTGGPFGAEGPIIQTGGAIGSSIGQLVSMTATERKVLLAAGAGAGMAATFNTPIAGVILAIELLLFEFRARSFIPLVIASTLATSVRYLLLGQRSMFQIGNVDFGIPYGLPWYLILGVLCGAAAVGLTKFLYWVEDVFERLKLDKVWHPAIGALSYGIIGLFVPRVLGVGYDTISDILSNNLTLEVLLLIVVFKTIALVISLGSGTSGGLLAPTFMSSAAMGGLFAGLVNHFVPGAHLSPGAYAVVAMGAVFGAASRATFTFIVFAFEITHDFNSILPLMLVCVIADAIALRYLPSSIMTEKLSRRGLDVHQEFEADVLKQVKVRDIMRQDIVSLPPETTIRELGDRIAKHDVSLNMTRGLPVVTRAGELCGLLTQSDLLRALEKNPAGNIPVLDAASTALLVTYPDERAFDALYRMLQNNVGRLPVVDRKHPRKLVGFLNRSSVLSAWTRQFEEENVREAGWLDRFLTADSEDDAKNGATLIGIVQAIGESTLRVAVAGEAEARAMEFATERALAGISVGDRVKISYHAQNGTNILDRVEELRTV